jgi:hypothetical protein
MNKAGSTDLANTGNRAAQAEAIAADAPESVEFSAKTAMP